MRPDGNPLVLIFRLFSVPVGDEQITVLVLQIPMCRTIYIRCKNYAIYQLRPMHYSPYPPVPPQIAVQTKASDGTNRLYHSAPRPRAWKKLLPYLEPLLICFSLGRLCAMTIDLFTQNSYPPFRRRFHASTFSNFKDVALLCPHRGSVHFAMCNLLLDFQYLSEIFTHHHRRGR